MINQTISHYRITGQLGSGGMGVVYEAEDLTLGRKVALKFLPPQLSRDQNALERFLLEARTASALNHPNICTIYAVESVQENGQNQSFIAMELLEGQNLGEKLHSGPLPADRLLDIAIQLADALDAAHAKGIIHRDIKSANIFIGQRGQVKVLDFGLAKLARSEMDMETIGNPESPHPANLTSPGATVGTISYMSPEQARGEELDTRTDLFSLGIVLYQMATGKMPFAGATSAVVFHAILQLDPVPVVQLNPSLPPKLEEIIEKLLEKDRDLRYQSAADLRGDLKRLKRDTESGRRTASSASGPASAAGSTVSGSVTVETMKPKPVTAPAQVSPANWRVRRRIAGVIMALLLLIVIGDRIRAFMAHRNRPPFQNISISKVTDSGNAALAAISPDGKYILSLMRENGLASLWLRNVPTNSNTQVQPAADVVYGGLTFSNDGNYFYFVRSDPGNQNLRFLYRAPLLGGSPQKLVSDVDSNVTFSPDGSKFAFMRFDNPFEGQYQLIIRSLDSGEERVVISGSNSQQIFAPAWAPDGKTIVCNAIHVGKSLESLISVDVASGKSKVIYDDNVQVFGGPKWLPDGSGVVGFEADQAWNFSRNQLSMLSYPSAKLSPITRDTNSYSDLSVAASGRVLAAVLSESRWNLYVVPTNAQASTARQVTATSGDTNFTWTRDNQIIADQANTLHAIDPATGSKTPFSGQEGKVGGNPAECVDGRYVVFDLIFHAGSGDQNIWRTDSAGGNLKQLTTGNHDTHAECSPDNRWAYYISYGEQAKLTRVPLDGGTSQTISDLPINGLFDLSPDGKLVAFATLEHVGEHKEKLAVVSTELGQNPKIVDFERPRFGILRFSLDGKAVVYPTRDHGVDDLWVQPVDGSKGRYLTDFKSERIYDFHWSFDGRQLALVRGHNDSDVVLIRDMQQQ
jgi:eukaryotic-like serine/threonine-protein kinase